MIYGIDNIRFTEPAFNLALEEYCFRHLHPEADVFLLYVNAPSVVIGRHQNPIEELDLEYAQQKGMQVVRRISGGGAVYHDHGNINYSLLTSFQQDSLANIPRYLEPVVNALTRLGIGAHIDNHNNICIDSQKISGTSQYSDTRRLLVHGTLLFDTDLWVLKRVLMTNRFSVMSRSRKSIYSPVDNITTALKTPITLPTFRAHLWASLADCTGGIKWIRFADRDWQQIRQLANTKYRSWEWTYAKSPDFHIALPTGLSGNTIDLVIYVRRWRIQKLDIDTTDMNAVMRRKIRQDLIGRCFSTGLVQQTVISAANAAYQTDLHHKLLATV